MGNHENHDTARKTNLRVWFQTLGGGDSAWAVKLEPRMKRMGTDMKEEGKTIVPRDPLRSGMCFYRRTQR